MATSAPSGTIGHRLRAVREMRGWSIRKLERQTGGRIKSSHISQIESGKVVEPSLAVLRELASGFDLHLGTFLKMLDVVEDHEDDLATADERVLLSFFRELDEDSRAEALDFVRWRVARSSDGG